MLGFFGHHVLGGLINILMTIVTSFVVTTQTCPVITTQISGVVNAVVSKVLTLILGVPTPQTHTKSYAITPLFPGCKTGKQEKARGFGFYSLCCKSFCEVLVM